MDEISEALNSVADRIEREGWMCNTWNVPGAHFDSYVPPTYVGGHGTCAGLALAEALSQNIYVLDDRYMEAVKRIRKIAVVKNGEDQFYSLISWNNTRQPTEEGRQEVITVFCAAAKVAA